MNRLSFIFLFLFASLPLYSENLEYLYQQQYRFSPPMEIEIESMVRKRSELESIAISGVSDNTSSGAPATVRALNSFINEFFVSFTDLRVIDRNMTDSVLAEQNIDLSGITENGGDVDVGSLLSADAILYCSLDDKQKTISDLVNTDTSIDVTEYDVDFRLLRKSTGETIWARSHWFNQGDENQVGDILREVAVVPRTVNITSIILFNSEAEGDYIYARDERPRLGVYGNNWNLAKLGIAIEKKETSEVNSNFNGVSTTQYIRDPEKPYAVLGVPPASEMELLAKNQGDELFSTQGFYTIKVSLEDEIIHTLEYYVHN